MLLKVNEMADDFTLKWQLLELKRVTMDGVYYPR